MEKAIKFLAKATTAAAAVAFLLAVVVMVDSRSLFAWPLSVLGLIAGGYSFWVLSVRPADSITAPVLRQRIPVS